MYHNNYPTCPRYLAHQRRVEREAEFEAEREKLVESIPFGD
ncbi:MAG: hypothetical protein AABX83_01920 [Nanoarchaeota archaeon]